MDSRELIVQDRSVWDTVSILCELIRIPSQNGQDSEFAMAIKLKGCLEALGFSTKLVSFAKDRPNVIGTLSFGRPGTTILINAHMDTKPAGGHNANGNGWATDPFVPTVKDKKVYGLGACDTKGGIACLLAALHQLRSSGVDRNGSGCLLVHFVCDEERDSELGTKQLCSTNQVVADFAIVLEPTSGRVAYAQLGNLFLVTDIWTCGGHTGVPKNKKNAFDTAIRFVTHVDTWVSSLRASSICPGQPFINIGRFEGGTASGTIPGHCRMFWSVRIIPGHTKAQYIDQINVLTESFPSTFGHPVRCCTSLDGNGGLDSYSCEHPLMDHLIRLSGMPKIVFPGSTDAALLQIESGVPSCIFGPGSLDQAHAPDEYCSVEDLYFVTDMLIQFLSDRMKGPY